MPSTSFMNGTSLLHKRDDHWPKLISPLDGTGIRLANDPNDSLALAQWSTAVAQWSNAMVPVDMMSGRSGAGAASFALSAPDSCGDSVMHRKTGSFPPPAMDLLLLAVCMVLAFRYALAALLRSQSQQNQPVVSTPQAKATADVMCQKTSTSISTNTDSIPASLPLLPHRRMTEPALLPTAQQRQDWAPSVLAPVSAVSAAKGKGVTSVDTDGPVSRSPLVTKNSESEDAETPKVPLQRLLRTYSDFPMDDVKTPRQSAAIAAVKFAHGGKQIAGTKKASTGRKNKKKRFTFAVARFFGCKSTKSIDVIEPGPLAAEP